MTDPNTPENGAEGASTSLPPLAQPEPTSITPAVARPGALPDDSALREAEAVRSGAPRGPEPAEPQYGGASAEAADLDDTRITPRGPGAAAPVWTPSPAPFAAPAPAVQREAPFPAEAPFGFGDTIAGDDAFTPAELAQRKALRDELAFRQKQEFSGINFGAGFFGWLAAVGLSALLLAVLGGVAVASGLSHSEVTTNPYATMKALSALFGEPTVQISGLVAFLFILLLSYFVGGFVAARIARFSGLRQGLAVWLWGLVVSIVAGVVLAVIASQSTLMSDAETLGGSTSMTTLTGVGALVTAGLTLLLSIVGALLGALVGIRFHRRVDSFGLEDF